MKKVDMTKIKLSELFYNDKFAIVFSIILSLIIWLTISSNGNNSRAVKISDIPVTIQLSDNAIEDGLRVFSGQDVRAEVYVSGNRLIVGQLKESDIEVVALQAGNITVPGNYILELTARKASRLNDYNFSSGVSPGFITVSVDRYREAEFLIEDAIQYRADPDYFASGVSFSNQSVVISGPETEISKIKRVVANYETKDILKSTIVVDVPLTMYDSYGEIISSDQIEMSVKSVEATIPILKKKEVNIGVDVINGPINTDFINDRIKITPSSINLAAPFDIIDNLDTIQLIDLDFTKVNPYNNKFELNFNLTSEYKNLSNHNSAAVNIDMAHIKSKKVYISDFKFLNLQSDKDAVVNTDSLGITIWGLDDQIKQLSASDIEATVNMKDKEGFTGYTQMPIDIKVTGKDSCWAYGNYNVNIQVFESS